MKCMCDTEAKMPTIRKTMKTINMLARRVSITAVISSGALSVNTTKKKEEKKDMKCMLVWSNKPFSNLSGLWCRGSWMSWAGQV